MAMYLKVSGLMIKKKELELSSTMLLEKNL